ncbi:AbrB/MazE/SpoVT family DNA-binding domain-containing protein [Anaerococcus sp. ENR0831]|uniref:AbrB/MazE/SpoVT family DNA-binding domain-containing protein n=1 Tax=Anaerococcus martiniensis TaxID=3115615 RepID=A0ABW9M9W0_9FIRM
MNDIISMKWITKNTECQGDKDIKNSKQSHTNLEYENKTEKNEQGFYAWTAKVDTKGQIVIPKEARKLFNIESGDTILLLGD